MTSEELREIVPTDVEAWMIEDIIWPARSLCLCYDEDNWYYGTRYGKVHPDDAAAQIERRLVEHIVTKVRGSIGFDHYERRWVVLFHTDVGRRSSGESPITALVAAYRAIKENKR